MNRRTVLLGAVATVTAVNAELGRLAIGSRLLAEPINPDLSSFHITSLTCEYATNPLGIETFQPRLNWAFKSAKRGFRQTAYRIEVASTPEYLRKGHSDLWDSGKVQSNRSIQIQYDGKKLISRQRCYWRVTAWDADDTSQTSEDLAFWEMGLLSAEDWTAQWIGFPGGWPGRALYFRGEFKLEKPIRTARAYVAGLGYYEFRVNGHILDDRKLDPGWTDYTRRIQYATYDITAALQSGDNVFAAVVGRGWFGDPIFLLQAEITNTDGSLQYLRTRQDINHPDLHWQITSGPIVSNSVYDGETYDARLEKSGWDLPGPMQYEIHDRREGWVTPNAVAAPGGKLVSEQQEPIRIVESFPPQKKTKIANDIYVFDVGQNMAGWAQIRVRGKAGQRIVLKFAETLHEDGTVNQANLRKAAATDEYICRGEQEEIWEPSFTYHGFRYIQIEGYPGEPTLDRITARRVRSSVKPNGSFTCSNPLLNQIQQMVQRTEASNLYSVPTDCSQRDERMGWMNDLTVRIEESLFNFQLARFYRKYLDDVADTQQANGAIADTAPFRWGSNPADPVSASYLLMGWLLYKHYGDIDVLSKHYMGFKAWIDFLAAHTDNCIVNYGYYGDWSPPAAFGLPEGSPVSKDTPVTLMSTGYLFYTAKLISSMAGVLNNPADASKYQNLANRVQKAFHAKFWNEAKGGYGESNQAANAFALYLGIVPTQYIDRVVESLVKDVEQHNFHLTTGNLCTKYLLEALTRYGRVDAAFNIATQSSYPSWGYMLANGATTLWERWENMTGSEMNSHNHPMLGSVSSWFFTAQAGLDCSEEAPGFQETVLKPSFPKGLSAAKASCDSLYGPILFAWERSGNLLHLELSIPANAYATLHLPGGAGTPISEDGRPLNGVEGIEHVHYQEQSIIIRAGSGKYRLRMG